MCFAVGASAGTIQLGIAGDAQVSTEYIDFGQFPSGSSYVPYPDDGSFEISIVNPGVFQNAGVTAGEFGNIQSISTASEPPGQMLNPTPGTTSPFMTFDTGGSNLQLYLTELTSGSGSSPFTVTNTEDGTVVAFSVDGFTYDVTTSEREYFTGTFSATFDGNSITDLPIDSPYTATFSASFVPEPSTLLLLGLGAVSVGLIGRFRR